MILDRGYWRLLEGIGGYWGGRLVDGFDAGRDKFSKVVGVWECGDGIGKDVRKWGWRWSGWDGGGGWDRRIF